MTQIRTYLTAAAGLLCVALAGIAAARPVTVGGQVVELVVPAGYCELGASPPEERLRRIYSKVIDDGTNLMLSLFAACDEVAEVKAGGRTELHRFGQILLPIENGRPMGGIARAEYIAFVVGAERRILDSGFAAAKQKLNRFDPIVETGQNFGVIASDDAAAYMAIASRATLNDKTTGAQVGVIGATIVRDMGFSVNLYRRAQTAPDLQDLLAVQKANLATFVRSNR
ncbi:hypothetical protein [Variovorax ginsengisoli]|uniref:Uncharacterized protein n=1 Tax=Variovorax ginsengisoli TaxID=363844 RepID=A0ABT8SG48_9BURK|nr:hypothetical protein [Variovorax ginsengisoli]MDN8618600.1 hypothetical protein [Variovorax ginsengisoli]MDO1537770.1 hypothetical protein [Variovorax ginsengisoli]